MIGNLYKKIRNYIRFKLTSKRINLLIYDDIFPHPISGFRLEEFTVLLKKIKKSKILVDPHSYPVLKSSVEEHKIHVNSFLKNNNRLKKSFINKNELKLHEINLFYCVFLHNIYANIDWLEHNKIPFVFTLYPGGGLELHNYDVDIQLKRVLSSSLLKKVIVTQKIVKDYLINNSFCEIEKIELIFGVVVPQNSIFTEFKKDKKETFDIIFCASKYMPLGLDKGYEDFILIAHKLHSYSSKFKFHVVGGFDENEIDISGIKDSIKFYGYQNFENLSQIFKNMDVIISPNKPFLLSKGAFDGFPLATTIEAVFCGVVAIVNDCLNEGNLFNNQIEIIITNGMIDTYVNEIKFLFENPSNLKQISKNGKKKFSKIFNNKSQISPRIKLLKTLTD